MSAIVSRMPIFQSADARIDDLDRRQRELDRAQNVGDRQMLVVEVAADDEGDLGLDLGLDQLVARDVPAVGNRHVVEQHAVVRLIDAELALHGERSQTDLASDQPSPLLQPPLRVDLLRRIGEVDRVGGQHLPHRRNWRSRVVGLEDRVGDRVRRWL